MASVDVVDNTHQHDHLFSHSQAIRAQALKVARSVLITNAPLMGNVVKWTSDDFIKLAQYIVGDVEAETPATEWERELMGDAMGDPQHIVESKERFGRWEPAPNCYVDHPMESRNKDWRSSPHYHEHWISEEPIDG
jgi:hypothetical protein